MLLIGLPVTPLISGLGRSGETTGPPVYLTSIIDPASPVFAQTALADIANATIALDTANYTSTAGAIVSAVYTVNGALEPSSYVFVEGDAVAIRVTDEFANQRSFGVGTAVPAPLVLEVVSYGTNLLQITGLGEDDFILDLQNDDFSGLYTTDTSGAPLNLATIQAQGGQALVAPTLEGSTLNGATLTVEGGLAVIDNTAVSVTTSWQWMRDGTPIAGATSSEYTTQPADAGMTLWAVELFDVDGVTFENPSADTRVIEAPQILNTVTFQATDYTALGNYVGQDNQPWSSPTGSGADMVILSDGVFPYAQGAGSLLLQAGRVPRTSGMVTQTLRVAPQTNSNTAIGATLYDPVSGYSYVARANGDNNRLEFYLFGASNIRFEFIALTMSANLTIPTISLRIEGDVVSALYDGAVIATRSRSQDGFGDHIPGLRGFEKSNPSGSGVYVADFIYEELE